MATLQSFISLRLRFRYTQLTFSLAVQELDEKHMGNISLRTQEGLLQVGTMRYLKTTLLDMINAALS